MSNHDQEMDLAMSRIGVLRFRLDEAEAKLTDLKSTADRFKAEVEHLTSENQLVREESDRHYQLWVDSQAEVIKYQTAHDYLQSENARLKAEVERLTKGGDALYENQLEGMQIVGWEVEDCPLMMAWNAAKEGKQSEEVLWVQLEDYEKLKAEVERLRKAGDVLADKAKLAGCNECFGMFNALEDALDAWNAAKEGKPSV